MDMEQADRIAGIIFLVILFAAGTAVSAGNIFIMYKGRIKNEKTSSPAPFLGGFLISFGLAVITGFSHPWKFIIPFVTDTTVPMIIDALRRELFSPDNNKNDIPEE